jgi:hypothetical protein
LSEIKSGYNVILGCRLFPSYDQFPDTDQVGQQHGWNDEARKQNEWCEQHSDVWLIEGLGLKNGWKRENGIDDNVQQKSEADEVPDEQEVFTK